MQTNKEKYRELCKKETSIPIFSRDWWLDATAGDSWDVVLVENKGGEIQASLPFMLKKRYGFTLITQPQLTQTLGPWIRPSTARYSKQLAQEKELLQALFDQLPPHDYYGQSWHHSRTNWLPLYWKEYRQTTRYTYRIEDLSDLDKVWSSFSTQIRSKIIKAKKDYGLSVIKSNSADDIIKLDQNVYEHQNIKTPYSDKIIKKIYDKTTQNNSGDVFIALDPDGTLCGGIFLIWDGDSAYLLMSGNNPKFRQYNAKALCIWESLMILQHSVNSFDFEGSMIERIESYNRNFGTTQTPYFHVTKIYSKILKAGMFLRGMI